MYIQFSFDNTTLQSSINKQHWNDHVLLDAVFSTHSIFCCEEDIILFSFFIANILQGGEEVTVHTHEINKSIWVYQSDNGVEYGERVSYGRENLLSVGMNDTSYFVGKRLEESVGMHKRLRFWDKQWLSHNGHQELFKKAPLREDTLLDREKRAFVLELLTNLVYNYVEADLVYSSVEVYLAYNIVEAAVAASTKRSLMKSTQKRSEVGVLLSTMRDHMTKDLNVWPYSQTLVNCWMLSWIGAMNHAALWRTQSQVR